MGITCLHCGTVNRAVATFCVQCNASLPTIHIDVHDDGSEVLPTEAYDPTGAFTRTQLQSGPLVRPAASDHALPTGTLIEGFRIERVVGEGGFGIVYLAWDAALERQVAIKEYMPFTLANRADSLFEVSVRSERDRDTFEAGLKSFVNEARLLARFDHPALLKVLRFWNGNRTAYMAMPYYEGPTLKAALAARGPDRPTETQLRAWLDPLLDALAVIHGAQCYHRDISPDNILLTRTGPLLLDFGAARRVITDMTQALTAVLKPGFAPIEQYGGDMAQGPWTDLYALGGVVYYAITGRPPVASVARVVGDSQKPLALTHAGQYSPAFLRAIDAALAIRPEARPQDVTQFRALLDMPPTPSAPPVTAPPAKRAEASAPRPMPVPAAVTSPTHRGRHAIGLLVLILLSAGAWTWWARTPGENKVAVPAAPVHTPTPAPAPPTAVAPAPPAAPVPAPPAAPAPPAMAPAAAPAIARPRPSTASRPAVAAVATEAERPSVTERTSAPARSAPDKPARCAEIVQKSTLESLHPEEITYLKKACR